MGRPVMLSNGSLAVGLNEFGLVHDFYYPYVGLDNLTTARSTHHKIGIWVDGIFSWIGDDGWTANVDFESSALISAITLENSALGILITCKDFIDYDANVFGRVITVKNKASTAREVRVFLHQVFEISRAGRADTALFVPDENYILDYKGHYCLTIYGQHSGGAAFDQFAIGNYGIEGKAGTFKDAEDGELSGNAVEHGGVDSVMRFLCSLDEGESNELHYWIVAAGDQFSADRIHQTIKRDTLPAHLAKTREHWHKWLKSGEVILEAIDSNYLEVTKKSLLIIKSHIDKRGGVIASCDSSIYNYGRDYYSYVWPRDGAFALLPLIRMGFYDEARRFFEFCRDTLTPDGYLMHKYQPDRTVGSTWHPLLHKDHSELAIQEDETGAVLYLLGEYYTKTKDTDFVLGLYSTFVQKAANFMAGFIDQQTGLPHSSYDLWEQKFLTTTYTSAIVYRSLLVAAKLADEFEYPDDAVHWRSAAESINTNFAVFYDPDANAYRKGYLLDSSSSLQLDNTLDVSSMYAVMKFARDNTNQTFLENTVRAIEERLLDKSPSGGVPRYEHDDYFASSQAYLGNPWIVTTLWMAQYYNSIHKVNSASMLLDWAIERALPSGVLPEQVNPANGSPISVAPLVWSHAELINTILDLSN